MMDTHEVTTSPISHHPPSKASVARTIFIKMRGYPRKDVIKAFMNQAGLTYDGAGTYYQNFRKSNL